MVVFFEHIRSTLSRDDVGSEFVRMGVDPVAAASPPPSRMHVPRSRHSNATLVATAGIASPWRIRSPAPGNSAATLLPSPPAARRSLLTALLTGAEAALAGEEPFLFSARLPR